ncbi:MAG TPA: VWA domain-containing protein [Candidatus Polarisedimenticolaceae bacterium]|nr:VWA domain-containing protein [Candidatus Polarisedimenticolaceae bacterium]
MQLAQFDVVVRDKQGRIVPGLGKDDFEVLEDGKPLEVEAVDAWGKEVPEAAVPTPPAAAPPPSGAPAPPSSTAAPPRETRSFVLLFDALTTTSALRLHQAKRAAAAFVRTQLTPEDLVSVYKLDSTLRPQSGFSRDRAATAAAIEAIGWMPNEGFEDEIAESVLAYRSKAGAGVMPERLTRGAILNHQALDWTRDSFYRMLQSVAGAFEGLPGRHVLVLLSPGLPMTTAGDFNKETGGFTALFRDVLKELARQGVTVYSIDIGDDLAIGDASKNIDWRVAAGKIGIDESAIADLGLDRALGSGSASQRRQVLGVLAAETGGRLLTQSDLGQAFALVDEESSRFYRISCKVPDRTDTGKYHGIVIRVKRPEMTVASRRGRYGDVVPGSAGRGGEGGRQVADSLTRYRSLPLRGSVAVLPSPDGGPARVGVVVEALGPVELSPGEGGGATLDLDFIVVARAGGEIVARADRPLSATVKPQGVAAVEKGFRLEAALALPPGPYEIQANVRMDRPAQFASWTAPVVVPSPSDEAGLRFEEVVLAPPPDAAPLLVQARDEKDPFSLGPQVRLLPATAPSYPVPGVLSAMFWIRGLTAPEGASPRLHLVVEVADGTGKTRTLPAKLAMFQPDGRGGHRGLVEIDLAGLQPGGYALTLRAADQRQEAAPAAVTRRGFEIR